MSKIDERHFKEWKNEVKSQIKIKMIFFLILIHQQVMNKL